MQTKVKDEVKDFAECATKYVGQKVAVICARYQYRGILSAVLKDSLVISNATSVEVSGASNQEAPQTEDPINGTVVVKSDAVEILYQPHWVNAPLPGEDETES